MPRKNPVKDGKDKSAIRLASRIKSFDETMRKLGPQRAKGYRKPGSQRMR